MIRRPNIVTLTDADAERMLFVARFPSGVACPHCSSKVKLYFIKSKKRWRCDCCDTTFSAFGGTHLHSMRLSPRHMVICMLVYCAAKKGISSCELARSVGIQQCSAFYILRRFREAISAELESVTLQGTVEIDGAFFGGHVRHENAVKGGRQYRYSRRNSTNRRVVTVLKQRLGRTLAYVGHREFDAVGFIKERVAEGSTLQFDQSHAWDGLTKLYAALRINHKFSFASNSTYTNNAESYFARLRRMAMGTHHRISGPGLQHYANEMCWRSDFDSKEMLDRLLLALMKPRPRLSDNERRDDFGDTRTPLGAVA